MGYLSIKRVYQEPAMTAVHLRGESHLLTGSQNGIQATISGYGAAGDNEGFESVSSTATAKGNNVDWDDDWSE